MLRLVDIRSMSIREISNDSASYGLAMAGFYCSRSSHNTDSAMAVENAVKHETEGSKPEETLQKILSKYKEIVYMHP